MERVLIARLVYSAGWTLHGHKPGALDPGVVLYLFQNLKLSPKEVEAILYKKSGLLGISDISNDMRDLLASHEPSAHLTVDYFVYRAVKEIGALAALLKGVDALCLLPELVKTPLKSASGFVNLQHGSVWNLMPKQMRAKISEFRPVKVKFKFC